MLDHLEDLLTGTADATFLNHYECTECGTEWSDEWSCACDDRCPECDLPTSPIESEELAA